MMGDMGLVAIWAFIAIAAWGAAHTRPNNLSSDPLVMIGALPRTTLPKETAQ